LFLARELYHVRDFGNLLSVFLLVSIGTISFGSLGLVIASVTNTMQETQVLNQLLWLPLIFLSGATIPFTALSKSVQHVALFLPATYLVHGLRNAIFMNDGPEKLLIALVSLGVWFLLTLFLSSQLFRWEPEAKIARRAKFYVAATAIPFILLGIWEVRNGRVIAEEDRALQKLEAPHKFEKQKEEPPKVEDSKPDPRAEDSH
jgi:hypothetical protein